MIFDIKEIKTDIKELYQKLSEIKPVNIYNQISLTNNKDLEDKIIELLDQLLKEGKSDKGLKSELEEVKEIIKEPTKDRISKNKLINFFKRLGDDNSDLNKTIKGAGIASKVVKELTKLGEKLKDLINQ